MNKNKYPDNIRYSKEKIIFYLILFILGTVSLYIIKDYIGLFLVAIVITMVFEPLYLKLHQLVKQPALASIITTISVIFLGLIPLALIITLAIGQAVITINSFQKDLDPNNPIIQFIVTFVTQIQANTSGQFENLSLDSQTNLPGLLSSSLSTLSTLLFKNVFPLISYSIQAIAQTIFFFIFISYLFPFRRKMFQAFAQISPLGKAEHQRLVDKFEAITIGTMKSIVIVGFFQGFLGAIMLSILKFPAAVFWGMIMAVASMIPLGSGIIWIPLSIYLALTGQFIQAIILFAWGTVIISSTDNIIRAKLFSKGNAQLPEILTLLSFIGGISTFGFLGIIYGPAIVGLFYTALTIYHEQKNPPIISPLEPPLK